MSSPTSTPPNPTDPVLLPTPIVTLQDNISIRPWHLTDATPLHHHANNPKISNNMTDRFPHPYTFTSAEFWITHCTSPTSHLSSHPHSPPLPSNYAICHLDQPIGAIGLERDPKQPHVVDIGYWLAEDFWGRGIATIVARAFLAWTWDVFPWVIKVNADAYGWNGGSMAVLRKIGMVEEGRRRLGVCKGGRYGDLVLFGVVREGTQGGEEAVEIVRRRAS